MNTTSTALRGDKTSLKGMTLLELIFVFSIIAMVAIGAFFTFNQISGSQRVSATNQAVATMGTGIKELYRGQSNFTSLTTEIAIRTGKVPADLVQSDTEIRNDWGGDIIVTGNSRDFEIEVNGVDYEACANLAAAATLTPTFIYAFQINAETPLTTPSVDPGTAATQCLDTGTNTLTYYVR
ncbi:type 4 pilus major pilin [Tranquillimonas alkanivorans]|uniref:Type II secretory pathway, pseudopilin PulG n=1 Tax=Tranquillimonas alkanivorans TaxID=441119 RepID=A0A1I5V2N4_9RHOB|nr:type 4 pilus major pilin [Tranquillimonas alkanivorans]SFQ01577.1 Type II secretory pathway, pseudopilin PulG [Tranquillimonas alkanivorans]